MRHDPKDKKKLIFGILDLWRKKIADDTKHILPGANPPENPVPPPDQKYKKPKGP